ncbi:hypothetical protein [Streptomyces sp. UG1]|uniref:hypothetical protein n=1 Tax=Streptomyces sp. UG1 TaxID=3417652 RepID=UPI003CFB2332
MRCVGGVLGRQPCGAGRFTTANRESFAAAEDLVAHLPSPTAGAVLNAARQAHDSGFTTMAVIATADLIVTAVNAAVLLRPRTAGDHVAGD